MSPPVELRTERVWLRAWTLSDAPALFEAAKASAEHMAPWIRWGRVVRDVAMVERSLRRHRESRERGERFGYGIFSPSGEQLLGSIEIDGALGLLGDDVAELGMWVHVHHAGRGLATEALVALVQAGLSAGPWARLEWRCDPLNLRSAALAARAGLQHELTLRGAEEGPHGERRDLMVFAALRSSWRPPDLAQGLRRP